MQNQSLRHFERAARWLIVLLALAASSAHAAAEDEVLVRSPLMTMTRADYEAELLRLAPELRAGFSTNAARVTELLNTILVNKTLAARAVREGLDRDPEVQQLIASETTKILARRELRTIEEKAGREFDAKDMSAAARERYLVDPDKYRHAEQVSVSHIFFDTTKHSDDEARRLALDARAKVMAGEDFNAVAAKLSEDPSAKSNEGRLGYFAAKGRFDPTFVKAAFALAKVGDVSEPIKTKFGWHVIRLDGRRPAGARPFDEVKQEIVAAMRQQYIQEARDATFAAIRNDPANLVNQPALDALTIPVQAPPSGVPRNSKR